MTIEKSPASTEAKPAATSDTKNAKGKASTPGKTDSGPPGGFMAILAAVDTPTIAVAAPVEDVSLSLPTDGVPLQATPAPPPDPLQYMNAQQAVLAVPQEVPVDTAGLLAQQASQLLSAQAQSARESNGEPTPTGSQTPSGVNGLNRLPVANVSFAAPNGAALSPTVEAGPAAARKVAKGQADFGAAAQAANGAALTSAMGTKGPLDARVSETAQKADALPATSFVAPAVLTEAASSGRRDDEGREKFIFKPHTVEVTVAPSSASVSTPGTLTAGTAVAPSPVEVYVAEQVKYWISNDVKNAEMTLDGVGANPVEVSISMQGNEAHVTFRTDEVQAREVLENASSHLKDMLQREGVVLSGVSVGTMGAGDAQTQDRKSRQGVRQSMVISANQPAAVNSAALGGRTSGRALDLFV